MSGCAVIEQLFSGEIQLLAVRSRERKISAIGQPAASLRVRNNCSRFILVVAVIKCLIIEGTSIGPANKSITVVTSPRDHPKAPNGTVRWAILLLVFRARCNLD